MVNITDYTDWDDAYALILSRNGFPEDTLIREYKLKNKHIVDILVYINEPIAAIEVKVGKVNKKQLKSQLLNIVNSFENKIEAYAVVLDNPKEGSMDIAKYYKLDSLSQQLEPIENIPNYSYFRSLKIKKVYNEISEGNTFFKNSSYILGIFMIIYHFMSVFYFKTSIETNQLIILLIGISLLLLPFFSKIKIAGIELERIAHSKEIKKEPKEENKK